MTCRVGLLQLGSRFMACAGHVGSRLRPICLANGNEDLRVDLLHAFNLAHHGG